MLRMTKYKKRDWLTTYNKRLDEMADGHYYILNKQSLGFNKARFKRMGLKNMPFHYKCRDLCGRGHWF